MLKGFWRSMPGASLWYKIKSLRWEIIYAGQRAWRGYDDTEVFDFNSQFIEKMINILTDFKKNNISLFNDVNENGDYVHLDEEQTNSIIQSIIDNFKESDEDLIIERKYGSIENVTTVQFVEAYQEAAVHRNTALSLLTRYFDNIWY